jgi:hypothetical protein
MSLETKVIKSRLGYSIFWTNVKMFFYMEQKGR